MNPVRVRRWVLLVCLGSICTAAGCRPWYQRWGIRDESELHSFRAIAKLSLALENGNCFERFQAGELVYEMGEKARSAVWALEKAISDQRCSFRQRVPAARALGRLGQPAFSILQKRLTSKHEDQRRLAVIGLGQMRYNPSVVVGLLTRKLASSDPLDQEDVRTETLASLGELGQAAIPAIPDLVSLLADPRWCFLAMDTLVAIGHPSRLALTALKKLADESQDADFKAHVLQHYDALMAKAHPDQQPAGQP